MASCLLAIYYVYVMQHIVIMYFSSMLYALHIFTQPWPRVCSLPLNKITLPCPRVCFLPIYHYVLQHIVIINVYIILYVLHILTLAGPCVCLLPVNKCTVPCTCLWLFQHYVMQNIVIYD